MAPEAISHIKETVELGQDMPLGAALTLERRAFNMLFDTQDQKEGMAAFIENANLILKDFRGRSV